MGLAQLAHQRGLATLLLDKCYVTDAGTAHLAGRGHAFSCGCFPSRLQTRTQADQVELWKAGGLLMNTRLGIPIGIRWA